MACDLELLRGTWEACGRAPAEFQKRLADKSEMSKGKRQTWKRGSVVRLSLSDNTFAYGQMLDSPEYAFFELSDSGTADVAIVAQQPVIFRLWVMKHAHGSIREMAKAWRCSASAGTRETGSSVQPGPDQSDLNPARRPWRWEPGIRRGV
jgi:hypothetical protein